MSRPVANGDNESRSRSLLSRPRKTPPRNLEREKIPRLFFLVPPHSSHTLSQPKHHPFLGGGTPWSNDPPRLIPSRVSPAPVWAVKSGTGKLRARREGGTLRGKRDSEAMSREKTCFDSSSPFSQGGVSAIRCWGEGGESGGGRSEISPPPFAPASSLNEKFYGDMTCMRCNAKVASLTPLTCMLRPGEF